MYYLQQKDPEAEVAFLKALKLDSKLASSHYQLARVYLRQNKLPEALKEIDQAEKFAPESESVHYVKGQILQHLGRTAEAKAEMAEYTKMSSAAREKRHHELEGAIPNPELSAEPQ